VIPTEQSQLRVAAATHPGMKGKNNEDRYVFRHFRVSERNSTPSTLAVVSDGIGGHRAGEVAAQIAVDTICRIVEQSDASRPIDILGRAISEASQRIRQLAEADSDKRGMGATCACAWVVGSRLYTASVGDTRIYWVRGEKIKKLSIDHTWVQEAIDLGALSHDQARDHPNAHVIRRYLGSPGQVVPDLRMRLKPQENDEQSQANQGLRLVPGDILLLCSDGLTDLVDDAEILAGIKTKQLDRAVEGLINLANERGGHDNITIIGMEMGRKVQEKAAVLSDGSGEKKASHRKWIPCLGLFVLLVLSLIVAGGFYWVLSQSSPLETPAPTLSADVPPFPPIEAPSTEFPLALPTEDPAVISPLAPTLTLTPVVPRPTYTPWPTSTP
jgi:PPM family protein phosphatase